MTTEPTTAGARLHNLRLYLASALALTYVLTWWSLAPTGADAPAPIEPISPPTATAQRSPRAAVTPAPRPRRVASPSRRVRTRSS
jgi:hypothetical protein